MGYDGSDPAKRALEWALQRAKPLGDEVVLLTVIPASVANSSLSKMMPAGLELPAPLAKTFEDNARERLDEVLKEHASDGVKLEAHVLKSNDPAKAFMEAIRQFGANAIVIGHKSFEKEQVELGPIAERLVKHMPATVTVVR